MRKFSIKLGVTAFFIMFAILSTQAAEIYVASYGKDTNLGNQLSPLATVQMAVRKARELRRLNDSSITGGIRIIVMDGT